MKEFKEPAFQTRLRLMADRLRKQTALWLTKALRTEVDPSNEYDSLVIAMRCECINCHCEGCAAAKQVCNAA